MTLNKDKGAVLILNHIIIVRDFILTYNLRLYSQKASAQYNTHKYDLM